MSLIDEAMTTVVLMEKTIQILKRFQEEQKTEYMAHCLKENGQIKHHEVIKM